jgi:pilus assembly protein CpaE
MNDTITALIALDTEVDRETVEAVLADQPTLEVAGAMADFEDASTMIAEVPCDLLLVACEGDSEQALAFIGGAAKERPDLPVVLLYEGGGNGFVTRAFAAGADEILLLGSNGHPAPHPAEVLFALQKAVARRDGSAVSGRESRSRTICVLGPKGGIGKTVLASNLGVTLAQEGHSVVLVDLDLQFGDLGLALGLSPERTIYDLATSGGALDSEKLDVYLATHESGARVLMAPVRPDQASEVTPDFLRRVYSLLRSTHDYVVVDTPPGFTPEVIASIDGASDVVMVGNLDALSLKSTKLGLETLGLMGYDLDRVRLVLNRADSRVGISDDDVVEVLGRDPDVLVPSHRDVTRSVNEAAPLSLTDPRSDAGRALRSLAGLYAPAEAKRTTGAKRARRSVLGRRG